MGKHCSGKEQESGTLGKRSEAAVNLRASSLPVCFGDTAISDGTRAQCDRGR